MILTPIILGFEVTDFDPNDEGLALMFERIADQKPSSALFLKKDVDHALLDNANTLILVDIILIFEEETEPKSERQKRLTKFKKSLIAEFEMFFQSRGILYKSLIVE